MLKTGIVLVAVFLISLAAFKLIPLPQEEQMGQIEGVQEQKSDAPYFEESFQNKLTNDPLWYLDPQVKGLIDEYLQADESTKSQEWISQKHGFFELLGQKIQDGNLSLGSG